METQLLLAPCRKTNHNNYTRRLNQTNQVHWTDFYSANIYSPTRHSIVSLGFDWPKGNTDMQQVKLSTNVFPQSSIFSPVCCPNNRKLQWWKQARVQRDAVNTGLNVMFSAVTDKALRASATEGPLNTGTLRHSESTVDIWCRLRKDRGQTCTRQPHSSILFVSCTEKPTSVAPVKVLSC